MSDRMMRVRPEWSAESGAIVVVIDSAIDDEEPAELVKQLEIDKSDKDYDGEPLWFTTEVTPVEAELLGREWLRHAAMADYLSDCGVDGPFSWSDEDETGIVFTIDERQTIVGADSLSLADVVSAFARCDECEATAEFGLLSKCGQLGGKPFAHVRAMLSERMWEYTLDDCYCPRCAGGRRGES